MNPAQSKTTKWIHSDPIFKLYNQFPANGQILAISLPILSNLPSYMAYIGCTGKPSKLKVFFSNKTKPNETESYYNRLIFYHVLNNNILYD